MKDVLIDELRQAREVDGGDLLQEALTFRLGKLIVELEQVRLMVLRKRPPQRVHVNHAGLHQGSKGPKGRTEA